MLKGHDHKQKKVTTVFFVHWPQIPASLNSDQSHH